jgi:hypothetical protein
MGLLHWYITVLPPNIPVSSEAPSVYAMVYVLPDVKTGNNRNVTVGGIGNYIYRISRASKQIERIAKVLICLINLTTAVVPLNHSA